MSQMFSGSICLTELIEKANAKHSAFTKGKNGKIYFNMITWLNDQKDDYGNTMSHQLGSTKENRDFETRKYGKCYVGNSKPVDATAKPITDRDTAGLQVNTDEIPERTNTTQSAADITEPDDDLPF